MPHGSWCPSKRCTPLCGTWNCASRKHGSWKNADVKKNGGHATRPRVQTLKSTMFPELAYTRYQERREPSPSTGSPDSHPDQLVKFFQIRMSSTRQMVRQEMQDTVKIKLIKNSARETQLWQTESPQSEDPDDQFQQTHSRQPEEQGRQQEHRPR